MRCGRGAWRSKAPGVAFLKSHLYRFMGKYRPLEQASATPRKYSSVIGSCVAFNSSSIHMRAPNYTPRNANTAHIMDHRSISKYNDYRYSGNFTLVAPKAELLNICIYFRMSKNQKINVDKVQYRLRISG